MKLNKLFSIPLGANTAPIGLNKKCDIFSAGVQQTGVWGSTLDTMLTNHANREIADSTNEMNYRLWQEQLAYQREQYEQEKAENRFLVGQAHDWDEEQIKRQHDWDLEQRRYDSPDELRKRYLAAGINPTLAMYGGSGGAGSHSAAMNTNAHGDNKTGQNPHMSPADPIPMQMGFPVQRQDWSGMMNFHAEINDMQYKHQMASNDSMRALAEVAKFASESDYAKGLYHRAMQDLKFNDAAWKDNLEMLHEQVVSVHQDNLHKELLNENQKLINEWYPKKAQKDIDLMAAQMSVCAAQVAEINARKDLTEQQKKTERQRTISEFIKNSYLDAKEYAAVQAIEAQAQQIQVAAQRDSDQWSWEEQDNPVGLWIRSYRRMANSIFTPAGNFFGGAASAGIKLLGQ